jgi:arylsulfatase A-like enzyme
MGPIKLVSLSLRTGYACVFEVSEAIKNKLLVCSNAKWKVSVMVEHVKWKRSMRRLRNISLISSVLFVCAIAPGQSLAQDRPEMPPNIVWIFVEDMNGWYGCYGDQTVPTPNIDALAARGVRFDRAYMPAGVCSATRSAIALGAMQTSLGVHNHRSSRQRVPEEVIYLPEGVKTVYQLMREAGYYVTSSKGKNDFNFIFETDDLYDRIAGGMGYSKQHWSDRPKGKPFFTQIQLRGGKNSGQFAGASKRNRDDNTPHTDPAKMKVAPYYPDHPVMRREYAHHYDCIRQTDDEVGQIIEALQTDGLLENTVVFFWTDHGLRLPRHKQWLYEGGIRVPLVVAGPGLAKDTSRDDLVSGIDITVSTLGMAGVEKPSWMEGHDVFATDYKPRQWVVSARDRCDYTIERVRAITTPRYKYIRNFLTDRPFMQPQYRDGRDYVEVPRQLFKEGKLNAAQSFMWSPERVAEEFYDLESDPHEINNLANDAAYAEALARHRFLLEDWMKKTDDQGQYPESVGSLRGVLTRWDEQAINPEYDAARN